MKKIIVFAVSFVLFFSQVNGMKEVKQENKEIEVKVKPKEGQLELLRSWLNNNQINCSTKKIKDWYFENPEKTFYTYNQQKGLLDFLEYVRIRNKNGKWIRCYKKREIDSLGKTLSVTEEEQVVDEKEIEKLEADGYSIKAIIKKTREVFLVNKTFEVAIDTIEEVTIDGEALVLQGPVTMFEVEHKKEFSDVQKGLSDIYTFLKNIGFKKIVTSDRGYLSIFANPKHDFSIQVDL